MKSFITLTDETIMPFGKYKGQALEDVDAGYMLWLESSIKKKTNPNKFENGMLIYIEKNRQDIEFHASNGKADYWREKNKTT